MRKTTQAAAPTNSDLNREHREARHGAEWANIVRELNLQMATHLRLVKPVS